MRGTVDLNILDEFCISFCDIIEKYCRYIIVSGFVAISSGRTRATEDIDMIIDKIDFSLLKKLHEHLIKEGFVCVQSDSDEVIYDYLIKNIAVRYTKKCEPIPEMEVKFAKDELDEYQLQTRMKLELTGLDIWFSSINMNIAFKEGYLKSDKDLKDAEHLRKVYPEYVSDDEISQIIKMINRLR